MQYRSSTSFPLSVLFLLTLLAALQTKAYAASSCPTCLPSFAPPVTAFSGTDAFFVAAADFNNDGKSDLAVTRDDEVLVVLGDGAGNFGAPHSFTAGTAARYIAVGDFNGDGRADLAVTNTGSKNISILLGDGAGGFGPATNIATADTPTTIVAAEFNGDGKLDLAVNVGPFCTTNTEGTTFCSANTLAVFPGDGAGGFGAPKNASAWSGPAGLRAGDFNGDGRADIAAQPTRSDGVVLLNDGTGGFGAPVVLVTQRQNGTPAVGDFNGDGKLDVAFLTNVVNAFAGNGAGGFTPTSESPASFFGGSLDAADFDGGGKLDLIESGFFVAQGDGAGGFAKPVVPANLPGTVVAIADFDSDGRPDVASVDRVDGVRVGLNRTACDRPVVCLAEAEVEEGTGAGTTAAVVEVSLSKPSDKTVTLKYAAEEYSGNTELRARASLDFKPVSGTLTFSPGATKQTITVPVVADRVYEKDQQFRVVLSDATNAALVPDTPGLDPPLVTIIDDDTLTLSVGDATVVEGTSDIYLRPVVFDVTASAPSDSEVAVRYKFSSGSTTFTQVVIYIGQSSGAIQTYISMDAKPEPDETFFINLVSASDNSSGGRRAGSAVSIARAQGVGTIIDDDTPANPAAPVLVSEDDAGRAVALDSVTLTRDPFTLDDPFNFSADGRTRLSLFARSLGLQPGEGASAVAAEAIDSGGNVHPLQVEFVGPLAGADGVTQIVVRLADDLPALGDARLRVRAHGLQSNEVFISLRPRAGGQT